MQCSNISVIASLHSVGIEIVEFFYMRCIVCNIDGKYFNMVYTSESNKNCITFQGVLYTNPPFDFKYVILNKTKATTFIDPKELDQSVCDRIKHIIKLNDQKKL